MIERHANPEDFDLYALGALDGEDKQSFETHVRSCAVCRQELAAARGRVALLGMAATPIAPPSSVKADLMKRVHSEQPASTTQAVVAKPQKRHWGLRFSLAFAAAAVILGFATAWLWQQNQQHRQTINNLQAELQSAEQQAQTDTTTMHAMTEVVGAPDTIHVTLLQQAGGPPGQAHVLYNARMGMAMYSGELAPAPADKSYQLWLVPSSGAPVSAGMVSESQQNGMTVMHLPQGVAAKAFAVTLEPKGGSPQPTGPKVLVGAINA